MQQPQKFPAFTWHQREKSTNPQHLFRLLWLKVSGVTTLKVQNEQRAPYTHNFVYVTGNNSRILTPLWLWERLHPNGITCSSTLFFQTLAGNKTFFQVHRLLVVQFELAGFCSYFFQAVHFKPYWKSSIFILHRFAFFKMFVKINNFFY